MRYVCGGFACVLFWSRAARRRLRGGRPGGDGGAARHALPPHRHREHGHALPQKDRRMVSCLPSFT